MTRNNTLAYNGPKRLLRGGVTSLAKRFVTDKRFAIFTVSIRSRKSVRRPRAGLFPPRGVEGARKEGLCNLLRRVCRAGGSTRGICFVSGAECSTFTKASLRVGLERHNIRRIRLINMYASVYILRATISTCGGKFGVIVCGSTITSFSRRNRR